MRSLYFFSGFDESKGFTSEIAKSLHEHITDKHSLIFIASCPFGYKITDFYKDLHTAWFRDIGIEFESVDVIDDRKTESQCAELISRASVIFLMGGTTLQQIEFLQKNKLIYALKQFNGVVMGVSAGAINMAENSFYSAYGQEGKTHIYCGIGLADISVKPHFNIENKALLDNDIIPFSNTIDVYAMCDDSAILVLDNERRYYGDIYLVSKGKIEKQKSKGKPHGLHKSNRKKP